MTAVTATRKTVVTYLDEDAVVDQNNRRGYVDCPGWSRPESRYHSRAYRVEVVGCEGESCPTCGGAEIILPDEPSSLRPGSPGKLMLLHLRYICGIMLHIDGDAGLDDDEDCQKFLSQENSEPALYANDDEDILD